jgi:putative membrane protein
MRKIGAAFAAVFMLAGASYAANLDEQFVTHTYGKNQHEISMGKMAAQKATNPDVKQFGQRIVDDHSKIVTDLQALAQKLNIDLSKVPSSDEMHKKHADKFDMAAGAQWDRNFMDWAVMAHQMSIDGFQSQIKDGKNADVTALANKYLPTIREHFQMAQDLNARISKGAMLDPMPVEQATDVSFEENQAYNEYLNQNPPAQVERRAEVVSREEPRTYREVEMDRDGWRHGRRHEVRYERHDRYHNGDFVSYEGAGCNTCEVKVEKCCASHDWPDIVYDNDYRALQTEYKDGDIEGAR